MPGLRLEVFDNLCADHGTANPPVEASAAEDGQIAAYEQGYSAGWEDATAAHEADQNRISSDLARNLHSLAFTFQDARSHILEAMRPLITEITTRVLPEVAREAIAPTVLDALMPMTEALADTPIVLVVNPAMRGRIEELTSHAVALPIVINEEPTLSEGQVYLRLGLVETKVDLTQAVADITAAVRAYFSMSNKEPSDG